MERCKEDGAGLFWVAFSDRMRGNRLKLKYKKRHLNIKIGFFTVRVTKHWLAQKGGEVSILGDT